MTDKVHGDMPSQGFIDHGKQVLEWLAEYLGHPERYPVLAETTPGAIRRALPASPPRIGEEMTAILADVERTILRGITHWSTHRSLPTSRSPGRARASSANCSPRR